MSDSVGASSTETWVEKHHRRRVEGQFGAGLSTPGVVIAEGLRVPVSEMAGTETRKGGEDAGVEMDARIMANVSAL